MTGWLRNVFGADKANDAQTTATAEAVAGQEDALDYLKEHERLPTEIRDEALTALRGFYDVPGQPTAARQYGGNIGQDQIKQWFQNNPNATDAEIATAMTQNGISPQQIAAATGKPIGDVMSRYKAQGGFTTPGFRGAKGQDELISQAMNSPLYAAIMGTKNDAVDAMGRYQSATGGLRSGNAQTAFAREAQRVAEEALLKSYGVAQEQDRFNLGREDLERNFGVGYNDMLRGIFESDRDFATGREDYGRALNLGGLEGLAGLNVNPAAIAGIMQNIGNTRASGTIAQANTQTGATNNGISSAIGLIGALAAFSDVRLKSDIEFVGRKHGFNWYRWNWNEAASELGLAGSSGGVMAHEVFEIQPEAVHCDKSGFLCVDYSALKEAA